MFEVEVWANFINFDFVIRPRWRAATITRLNVFGKHISLPHTFDHKNSIRKPGTQSSIDSKNRIYRNVIADRERKKNEITRTLEVITLDSLTPKTIIAIV